MKVISGKYKGRNILGFDLDGTRPTMDRVKESLFGMIQNNIPNSICLDLFAGSGNLGIEALSEGASFCYFCDSNHKAVQTINSNLDNIGIEDAKVLNMDYLKCLNYLHEEERNFDIIFLDPPYKTNYIEKALNKINELNLLKDDGIIVCESDSLDKIIYPEEFKCVKDRQYGEKFVVILRKM